DDRGEHVTFGDVAVLERTPFLGTVGVAPGEPGVHSVIPPRRVGGNLDCRDVAPGATLHLPVEVDGALLSIGDPHAAQGDGEVCGTAVEVPARARVRVTVEHDTGLDAPRLLAASRAPTGRGPDAGRHTVTFGIGPDLHVAARDATRRMIEWLGDRGVDSLDAYLLCSVAGHLRIVEVVNEPHWVVGLDLDPAVLA
ncbi:MAG: acetamidase/formamidase family protein, partial [Nitriliruptoraceae bacterium]